MTETAARVDGEVSEAEMESALEKLVATNEIHAHGQGYALGNGRSAPRRFGGHSARHAFGHTHREMILQVLGASRAPLGVAEIIHAIKDRFGADVPRTSVSPLLGKLKMKGGIVIHAGEKWTVSKT